MPTTEHIAQLLELSQRLIDLSVSGAADLGKRSGAAYPVYVSRADRPEMWCC